MSCRMLVRLCTSSVMAATGQRWSETGATLNNSDCCHACHTCVLPLIPCHYVFLCHALKSAVQTCLGWISGLLADEETKSVVQAQAVINKQHLTCHLCQWHLTTYVTLTDSLSHRTYGSLLACLSKCWLVASLLLHWTSQLWRAPPRMCRLTFPSWTSSSGFNCLICKKTFYIKR